ncbi:MAG: hypothetical protein CM15mP102_13370 [Flavobacteriales bacterium]|nr:MAG: hypothetical protein CM15mP102_13370 [Flavobacteriales bacterium]
MKVYLIYQDTITGQVQMQIRRSTKQRLYLIANADGIVRTAGFRGQYKDEKY